MGYKRISVFGFEFVGFGDEPNFMECETEGGTIELRRKEKPDSRAIPRETQWSCNFRPPGNEYSDLEAFGPTREDAMRALTSTPEFRAFADAVAKLANTAKAGE